MVKKYITISFFTYLENIFRSFCFLFLASRDIPHIAGQAEGAQRPSVKTLYFRSLPNF